MYGFHKTRQGTYFSFLSTDPNWREFKHPLFKKGHIELLSLIKRKNGNTKGKSEKRERCNFSSFSSFLASDMNETADTQTQHSLLASGLVYPLVDVVAY